MTFWNHNAVATAQKIGVGDIITIEGQIISNEHRNSNTHEVNYYPQLTGYHVEVLQKSTGQDEAPVTDITEDDLPF